ncbi:Transferase [Zobellia roscoffensis]
MFFIIFKVLRRIESFIFNVFSKWATWVIFKGNKVRFKTYSSTGAPYVMVARGGEMSIGNSFTMNNGIHGNPIGCYDKCTFFIDNGAELRIGKNVGMSQGAIICHHKITIGDNVKIGGGAKIYDTDFHALDPIIRASKEDILHKAKAEVQIKNNAFIGAFSIILKGVIIGENSIVGAGSVVAKSIPDNQIWAGNPAKFIREV